MSHTSKLYIQYLHDAEVIKNAILSAQYEATRGANNIQLMLYYSIGRFISQNTRKGRWGTGAIASISRLLKQDLPGLRGFSEANLKKMRTFYEEWSELDVEIPESNSLIQTSELGRRSQTPKNQSVINSLIQTDKPMGVATYKTATDMPEHLRNALPDQDELLKMIEHIDVDVDANTENAA